MSQIPMQVRVTTTAIPASVDTQTESIGSSWRSRNGFHLYLFQFHLPMAMAFLAYLHSDRCISGNAAPFGQLTVQTSCLFAVRDILKHAMRKKIVLYQFLVCGIMVLNGTK